MKIITRLRFFLSTLFLVGIPVPLSANNVIQNFLFIYTGVLYFSTKSSSLWLLIHAGDVNFQSEDSVQSEFFTLIDRIELFLECSLNFFIPTAAMVLFKRSVKMLGVLDRIGANCLTVRTQRTFNVLSVSYLIYYGVILYISYYSVVVILAFNGVAVFILLSMFQSLIGSILGHSYWCQLRAKFVSRKMLSDIDKVDSAQRKVNKYFGAFFLLQYVFIDLLGTLTVYFIFYRVGLDSRSITDPTFVVTLTCMIYMPFLGTLYMWKMYEDVEREVSRTYTNFLIVLFDVNQSTCFEGCGCCWESFSFLGCQFF